MPPNAKQPPIHHDDVSYFVRLQKSTALKIDNNWVECKGELAVSQPKVERGITRNCIATVSYTNVGVRNTLAVSNRTIKVEFRINEKINCMHALSTIAHSNYCAWRSPALFCSMYTYMWDIKMQHDERWKTHTKPNNVRVHQGAPSRCNNHGPAVLHMTWWNWNLPRAVHINRYWTQLDALCSRRVRQHGALVSLARGVHNQVGDRCWALSFAYSHSDDNYENHTVYPVSC